MTVLIVDFDPATGEILGHRHVAHHDYTPDDNEMEVESGDHRELVNACVDTSVDPPELTDDPPDVWERPGVVDAETRGLIAEQFRAAGADAIQAYDAMQSAGNVPQAALDYFHANLRMEYLVYVALTGDRIQTVEDRFFP